LVFNESLMTQENEPSRLKYRRIVLKLSGEALRETGSLDNISFSILRTISKQIKEIHHLGVEISVVVGGGNFWRGVGASCRGMDRTTADYIGMLATVMNGLALQSELENMDVATRVQTAIEMKSVAEPFIRRKAMRHLEHGRVVIFVAGTGNPFFSTDTTAALRANEIGAEIILKATKVDGVYDSDPFHNPNAKKFESLTHKEALNRQLKVMDSTAFSLCMDNKMPIIVFDMQQKEHIKSAVMGEKVGTLITAD